MNHWRTVRLYAAGSLLLPAAAIVIWQELVWMNAIFVVWTAAAACLWIWSERKEQAQRSEKMMQTQQSIAIRTLNHHRHDWMNDLQVLYGYIRMNKPDKTVECVEKIRERMMSESRIAKLGVPSLVMFVQSFRTVTNNMLLHVESPDDMNLSELPLNSEEVSDTIIDLINAYRFAVKPSGGDAAKLTLTLHRDERYLHIDLQFDGELLNSEELADKVKQRLKKSKLRSDRLDPAMMEAALRAELNG